jgi:Helix-turn-helix domain
MLERKRTRLSLTEKNDIWGRWKAGQSMHAIGRAYGRPHPTIRKLLLPRGGIAALARRRSRLALTLAEREDISRGIASGSSIREIARGLSRATSTVSREIVLMAAVPPIVPMVRTDKLGSRLCTQALPAGHEPQVAEHRCE